MDSDFQSCDFKKFIVALLYILSYLPSKCLRKEIINKTFFICDLKTRTLMTEFKNISYIGRIKKILSVLLMIGLKAFL